MVVYSVEKRIKESEGGRNSGSPLHFWEDLLVVYYSHLRSTRSWDYQQIDISKFKERITQPLTGEGLSSYASLFCICISALGVSLGKYKPEGSHAP